MADVSPPTIGDFLRRFPEFGETDEYQIEAILTESASVIDDSWRTVDQPIAIMYLAAHVIASGAEQSEGGAIESFSVGPISIKYRAPYESKMVGELSRSDYGLRFLELARKNCGGPRVV